MSTSRTTSWGWVDLTCWRSPALSYLSTVWTRSRPSPDFHSRLASFSRLIRLDLRGVGLSHPVLPSDPPTLEQWISDAVAVMDSAGSVRAAVFAPRDTSLSAILLAVTYPERVGALVIVNGTARFARAPDYPVGFPEPPLERFLQLNVEPDAVERGLDYLAFAGPSVAKDRAFRAWWDRAGNRGASPTTARAIHAVYLRADVRPLLSLIRVPTLVLHRRDNAATRVGHGRYLAEHIPEAKYVELPGADDLYWIGDTEAMLDEIEEFLTGVRHTFLPDRVLATVLSTDIVGPAPHIGEKGDARWQDQLNRHGEVVRRELNRFRGRQINAIGSKMLAAFDGPARAVRCACSIRDASGHLGLTVRCGIHTGEVEARSDDIGGVAVHIASQVEALATAGQVLVSRTVVDLVVGSGIEFADQGEHALSGVPGTWRLFAVGG
jgi:class 3 adenylate cyclase